MRLNWQITTTAQNIREIKVEMAAPPTPMENPKIRMELPAIFIKFEITDMIIGFLLLFWERMIEAPAS